MATLGELAALVQGELHGPADLEIHGAAILRDVRPGELTFADNDKAFKQLETSPAAAVLLSQGSLAITLPAIRVADVQRAFAQVVTHFRPRPPRQRSGVSSAARISATAQLADDVEIHPGVVVGDDVVIETGCTLYPGVVVMDRCRIGAGTTIFPNAVLYDDTLVGSNCILHAGVVLGAFGFGYRQEKGRHVLGAQLGWVELGADVELGAGTTIDRGAYGPTRIGAGTKIDNLVQIGHNCRIGKHNLICSQVGIAGSTTTGDYVVLAGQVGIRDHVAIGDQAQIGAKSGVMTDIPPRGSYVGYPALPEREQFQRVHGISKIGEMRKQLKALQQELDVLKARLATEREAA